MGRRKVHKRKISAKAKCTRLHVPVNTSLTPHAIGSQRHTRPGSSKRGKKDPREAEVHKTPAKKSIIPPFIVASEQETPLCSCSPSLLKKIAGRVGRRGLQYTPSPHDHYTCIARRPIVGLPGPSWTLARPFEFSKNVARGTEY